MQVYVQKSTRTTFPCRSAAASGGELSQPVAPSKLARRPSTGSSVSRALLNRLTSSRRPSSSSRVARRRRRSPPRRPTARRRPEVEWIRAAGVVRRDRRGNSRRCEQAQSDHGVGSSREGADRDLPTDQRSDLNATAVSSVLLMASSLFVGWSTDLLGSRGPRPTLLLCRGVTQQLAPDRNQCQAVSSTDQISRSKIRTSVSA
jgi:hypothetical protein